MAAVTLLFAFAWSPLQAQDARVVQGVVLDERKCLLLEPPCR